MGSVTTAIADLIVRQNADLKHLWAAESTLDVVRVLYERVLDVAPDRLDDPTRDRFLLSKGHGPHAYYAVLAARGFFPADWLDHFAEFDSRLGGHPDRTLVPGVEISAGSLGHGLPIAVGLALGLRVQDVRRPDGTRPRVVVLVGDGELDEGSNHEAVEFAAAAGLGGLTCVVVDNASARHRRDVAAVFRGWTSRVVDGRDHDALEAAFLAAGPRQPHVVVAEVTR